MGAMGGIRGYGLSLHVVFCFGPWWIYFRLGLSGARAFPWTCDIGEPVVGNGWDFCDLCLVTHSFREGCR